MGSSRRHTGVDGVRAFLRHRVATPADRAARALPGRGRAAINRVAFPSLERPGSCPGIW
jgi:hypothetical protein